MIEYLAGKLINKLPHRVVVEVSGIAFDVQVPFSTSRKLPAAGNETKILCHLQWRDDGPQLFGFASEDERKFFRILTKVNKVGPKLAINIMSSTTPESLSSMILQENKSGLNSLKGIGPKLASRLIVELKEPVSKLGLSGDLENEPREKPPALPFESDVREALENLGYTGKEINQSLKKVSKQIGDDADIEDIIEAVLKSFSS
ncbi:MAG: Holliday junction branch migration protein RuvA [Candidatus Rifleibacteriota bacterium]